MDYENCSLNEMVLMAKQGDKSAMENVIRKFTPFIYKMVGNLYIKDMDTNDLKQMGYISVIHAIQKFDPEKTKNFTSYVTMAIKNNYYYEVRKRSKENFDVSLENKISENTTFKDMLISDLDLEEEYLKKEGITDLKRTIGYLSTEEKELLDYLYKNPKKAVSSYAKEKGISTAAVYKRKAKLFKKMKELLK